MIVPPLRTTLLVTPDNDKNPPKRLQELGKDQFDQSSKNQNKHVLGLDDDEAYLWSKSGY